MEPNDLEEFETLEDVRTAVVYCIDLSSTMKVKLGKNVSRIEASKRALWSLYILNKKFFTNDSVFVVGFASLASEVNPFDIPFLKTYDANDNFLHYTNYQAALKLSRKILQKTGAQNHQRQRLCLLNHSGFRLRCLYGRISYRENRVYH